MDVINAIILRHKSSCKQDHQTRRGRSRWSVSKPQAASSTSATRTLWECCEHHNDTHPATTTTIVIAASIAATPVRRDKQEALPRQEALSRSVKCMPLNSYNASIRINENKNANSNNKIYKKFCAINVHHHDNCHHSSDKELRDDPRKSRRQQQQRERKQGQQLLVRR